MPSWRELTNLSRQSVTVKPFSVATVDYFDIKPNYYRVQNRGTGSLLCGTSSVPNKAKYDFIVHGESMKMYSEPARKTKLYIFNPTGSPINADVLAFAAEFDPLALALSDIEIRMPDEIASTSVISGFEAALPQGSNKIGSVEVADLPTLATLEKQNEMLEKLGAMVKSLALLVQEGSSATGYNLFDLCNVIVKQDKTWHTMYEGTANSSGLTYSAISGHTFTEIAFLSNDSESGSITLKTVESDGTENTITVKPGEVLNKIPCRLNSFTLTGADVPFRLVMVYKEKD